MILAHKIELIPTKNQETYFCKACGTARFVYNWGLAKWNELYLAGEKPNWMVLKKLLNSIKGEQFPWMYEVTKCAPEAALADLGTAFNNFFRDRNKKGQRKSKRPTFKKKGRSRDSFYISNDQFSFADKQIRLPHIGFVLMREKLRFDGKILGATVSRTADRWFVSIQVDVAKSSRQRKNQAVVGIDLGVLHAATLSTGKAYDAPKSLAKNLKKLQRLSRQSVRKYAAFKKAKASGFQEHPGTNLKQAWMDLARLHRKIANIRKDWLHKLTTNLTRKYALVALEDLNVAGMVKNRHLARAISDIGMGELERQLEYKALLKGGRVVQVGRFFPSSKLCRKCGTKLESLSLGTRIFVCPSCGHTEDRDLNAARNILREGLRISKTTDGPSGSNACGQVTSTKKRNRFASRLGEAGMAKASGRAKSHPFKHQEKVADV